MNAITRNEAPFYVDDLLAKICVNSSPVNQPMASNTYMPQETEEPLSWFMKLTEASYAGWRRNGSQSYGL